MPVITTIQDLNEIYQCRVPRMFYDYCESGSWTEQTFGDNISDFAKLRLRLGQKQRKNVERVGAVSGAPARAPPLPQPLPP